jgi:hypothetical protein
MAVSIAAPRRANGRPRPAPGWAVWLLAALLLLAQTLLDLHRLEHLDGDADHDEPAGCELCISSAQLTPPLPARPTAVAAGGRFFIRAARLAPPRTPRRRIYRRQVQRAPPDSLRSTT